MAQGNSKLFIITTALFVVLAIIFFTLSITALGKFTAQKKRVHHMEQQILAGKSEIMKVPEIIGKLRVADNTNLELESQVADLTEVNGEMESELTELQKELTTVTVAKLVLETDKAGYTKNLVEARQAVRELREHGSTDYIIDEIEETLIEATEEVTEEATEEVTEEAIEEVTEEATEATPEATHEPTESQEGIPSENVWE